MITTVYEHRAVTIRIIDLSNSENDRELIISEEDALDLFRQLILILHLKDRPAADLAKSNVTEPTTPQRKAANSLLRLLDLGLPISPSLAVTLDRIEFGQR